ncbi:MAG TPA: radical SAM/SPASM domain-containing protein [Bacteroidales bacterium]|nr:radical SAM/SPASM domain-containing protein [Bacteroidales bacterium]
MSNLAFKKYFGAFLGAVAYPASLIRNRAVLWGMPPSIAVELTNCCNLACPECLSGSGEMTRKKGYIDLLLFRKIFEGDPGFLEALLYFQGEPMLHPGFFQLISVPVSARMTISTNGHFIDRANAEKLSLSNLGKVIVSLDGMDNQTYTKYRRNGNIGRVMGGIRELSQAIGRNKSALKVEIQFLVNRHNESQVADARRFAKEMKCRFSLKSMQVIHPGMAECWMPEDEKFRRYRKSDGQLVVKSSLPSRCSRLWFSPVVTWDGIVVPCCFDKDASYAMGDLNKNTFREIWYGEKFMNFRDEVLRNRRNIAICRNCTSGLRGAKY